MSDLSYPLQGRTAVATGGGSDIGRESAILLARAGASVALIGRTSGELFSAIREMEGGEERHFSNSGATAYSGSKAAQVAFTKMIGFLASDAAAYITGTDVFIEGGQSLLQG